MSRRVLLVLDCGSTLLREDLFSWMVKSRGENFLELDAV
jgi:hypothetical protein